MLERGEALNRVAEGALESGSVCQRRTESQQFQRSRFRVVEHQQTVAETVGQALRVPARDWRQCDRRSCVVEVAERTFLRLFQAVLCEVHQARHCTSVLRMAVDMRS